VATDGIYESISPTGEEAPAQTGLELTGRQRDVRRELVSLDAADAELAFAPLRDMYVGAVVVLKQSVNPDRFAQAAHGCIPNFVAITRPCGAVEKSRRRPTGG
jgi:hypothetical protein